jgi:hypothetical protein
MTCPATRNLREGYAIQAFRVPLGETGEPRWDTISDGIPSRREADIQWNQMQDIASRLQARGNHSLIKTRMVFVTISITEVKYVYRGQICLRY